MASERDEILRDTFVRVIEVLAMAFAELAEIDELGPVDAGWLRAEITIRGADQGTIELLTTQAAAIELASSMLGVERDEIELGEAGFDALKEVLNVTAGQFLTDWRGSGVVFELGTPSVERIGDASTGASEWQEAAAIDLDGQPVLLKSRMSGND